MVYIFTIYSLAKLETFEFLDNFALLFLKWWTNNFTFFSFQRQREAAELALNGGGEQDKKEEEPEEEM